MIESRLDDKVDADEGQEDPSEFLEAELVFEDNDTQEEDDQGVQIDDRFGLAWVLAMLERQDLAWGDNNDR